MTQLDDQVKQQGYFPSTWAVECGGSRRQKPVGSPGLDLQAGEKLGSTSRDTGGRPVMFVQREPGELFLQGGAAAAPQRACRFSLADASERDIIDKIGLERGRAPIGASAAMGMFLCPGFRRDLYVASRWGTVAHIFVA